MTVSPPPTILLHADARDVPLLRRLAARGYRLAGFPPHSVEALRASGLVVGALDWEAEPKEGLPPQVGSHLRSLLPRWLATLDASSLPHDLGIQDRATWRAVQQALRQHVQANFLAAAQVIEKFDAIAALEHICLVLLRADGAHPGSTLALAAKLRGIPSAHVMHGIPLVGNVGGDLYSDVTGAYGPSTRDWYISLGVSPDRLEITGNPAWETYGDPAVRRTKEEAMRMLRLDPLKRTVLFANTWVGNIAAYDLLDPDWPWREFEQVVQAMVALRKRHDLQFIVKLHPASTTLASIEQHRQLVEQRGVPSAIVIAHAEPWQLAQSDCVVCTESNLGAETILLERPVVNLRFREVGRDPTGWLFRDDDPVLTVTDPTQIAEAIEAALFDTEVQARLAALRPAAAYRFNYLLDGRATERTEMMLLRRLDPAAAAREIAAGAAAPWTSARNEVERANVQEQHAAYARSLEALGSEAAAAFIRERAAAL